LGSSVRQADELFHVHALLFVGIGQKGLPWIDLRKIEVILLDMLEAGPERMVASHGTLLPLPDMRHLVREPHRLMQVHALGIGCEKVVATVRP
jgi:hypothetical protein